MVRHLSKLIIAALLILPSAAYAGPATYAQCQFAAGRPNTPFGQDQGIWRAFCGASLYNTVLYPEAGTYRGSCFGLTGASYDSKINFCRNFSYDNGQTP